MTELMLYVSSHSIHFYWNRLSQRIRWIKINKTNLIVTNKLKNKQQIFIFIIRFSEKRRENVKWRCLFLIRFIYIYKNENFSCVVEHVYMVFHRSLLAAIIKSFLADLAKFFRIKETAKKSNACDKLDL